MTGGTWPRHTSKHTEDVLPRTCSRVLPMDGGSDAAAPAPAGLQVAAVPLQPLVDALQLLGADAGDATAAMLKKLVDVLTGGCAGCLCPCVCWGVCWSGCVCVFECGKNSTC